ncbi:F-box protein [Camellia lanceoleosa]|uniref:F-box protein n=1 Tax=Camellia lanceoleosa TaxID=1840588 RepID=A0ACC0I6N8_9ERIC|nr:F-box protein [Camellia lanceoleosa]
MDVKQSKDMKNIRTNTDVDEEEEGEEELSSSSYLPLDLVFSEIFTRLPVKSLFRFKLVSKSMLYLTRNDPSFFNLHLSRSKTRLAATTLLISVFCGGKWREILSAELDGGGRRRRGRVTRLFTMPKVDHTHYRTLSYDVNGLLCLSSDPLFNICPKFKVLNFHLYNYSAIAYDFPGIAYRVFTLGGSSWRTIHPSFPFEEICDWFIKSGRSVCLNGAIHWFVKAKNAIVAFDLKDENFFVIPAPNCVVMPESKSESESESQSESESEAVLVQVNGVLAVIHYKRDGSNKTMEMWVLEDYQRHAWINHVITIDLSSNNYKYFSPIGSIPTGEILLVPFTSWALAWGVRIPVIYYDMKNKSCRIIEFAQLPQCVPWGYIDVRGMTTYSESLIFPTMDDQ